MHTLGCPRIDVNNELYYGLPIVQIQKLQRIQSAAARIILRLSKYDHITPALEGLNWLPIKYHILYKILTITCKAFNGQATSYGLRSDEFIFAVNTTDTSGMWGKLGYLCCCPERLEQTSLQCSVF